MRQVCPLSPVLFDFYINGLARELEGRGPLLGESRIPALLIADDFVLLAESARELQASADIISTWCDRWQAVVGITKCGALLFRAGLRSAASFASAPRLQGQPVPVVASYEYLGVLVDSRFSLKVAADSRIDKGRKTLRMTQPLLRNPAVPVPVKRLVVGVVVRPSTTYGAELFGEDARCVDAADKYALLPACLGLGARRVPHVWRPREGYGRAPPAGVRCLRARAPPLPSSAPRRRRERRPRRTTQKCIAAERISWGLWSRKYRGLLSFLQACRLRRLVRQDAIRWGREANSD